MNIKSLYSKSNDVLCAVMRSCTPHHRYHTDNEQQQTSSGTRQVDAGDKLILSSSRSIVVRPPQKRRELVDILFPFALPTMIISVVVMLVVLVLEILRRIP